MPNQKRVKHRWWQTRVVRHSPRLGFLIERWQRKTIRRKTTCFSSLETLWICIQTWAAPLVRAPRQPSPIGPPGSKICWIARGPGRPYTHWLTCSDLIDVLPTRLISKSWQSNPMRIICHSIRTNARDHELGGWDSSQHHSTRRSQSSLRPSAYSA